MRCLSHCIVNSVVNALESWQMLAVNPICYIFHRQLEREKKQKWPMKDGVYVRAICHIPTINPSGQWCLCQDSNARLRGVATWIRIKMIPSCEPKVVVPPVISGLIWLNYKPMNTIDISTINIHKPES